MAIIGLEPSPMPTRPAHFDIERVIRPNILALQPYLCARDDYSRASATGILLLDANENSLGHSIPASKDSTTTLQLNGNSHVKQPNGNSHVEFDPILGLDLHRYPDPSHPKIKERIAELRGLPGPDYVFLGVGSNEVIDILMRVCVAPEREKILITPPTYGMYPICAQTNDVGIVEVNLELTAEEGEGGEKGRFSLRVDEVKKTIDADPSIKLISLCSPGNPTGTLIPLASIRALLDYEPFKGIVVVDEAYIDFSEPGSSAVSFIAEYANICVIQTLSKSFGLAGIRLGIAIAQPPLIQILSNAKLPWSISTPTAHLALRALSPASLSTMRKKLETLKASRVKLLSSLHSLKELGLGRAIGTHDANFILFPVLARGGSVPDSTRAQRVYLALGEGGIVVRYRGNETGCQGCLRITIGTEEENAVTLEKLRKALENF